MGGPKAVFIFTSAVLRIQCQSLNDEGGQNLALCNFNYLSRVKSWEGYWICLKSAVTLLVQASSFSEENKTGALASFIWHLYWMSWMKLFWGFLLWYVSFSCHLDLATSCLGITQLFLLTRNMRIWQEEVQKGGIQENCFPHFWLFFNLSNKDKKIGLCYQCILCTKQASVYKPYTVRVTWGGQHLHLPLKPMGCEAV